MSDEEDDGALSQNEIDMLLAGVDMSQAISKKPTNASTQSDAQKKAAISGGTQPLSQDEISTLLNAIGASEKIKAEANASESQERPMKFSQGHLKGLSIIHQKFAYMTMNNLTEQLRTNVSLQVASVDQIYLDEYNRSIPVPIMLAVVNMQPLNGNVIIEVDSAITTAIIKKIYGGNEESYDQWYYLNLKEKNIIINLYNTIIKNLQNAWAEVINIQPRLVKIEPDPKFIRGYKPTEWVALVVMEAKLWDIKTMINIVIPHPVIEPVLDRFFVP